MLDGDVYQGRRREAELAGAIEMVIEVYSMVLPFLDGFGGKHFKASDEDEYYILEDTLRIGNKGLRGWLIDELHTNPGRAGSLCDGLIQIFETNFIPIDRSDYVASVIEALNFMLENPAGVDWEVYAAGVAVTAAVIYFSPAIASTGITIGRAALSREMINGLLSK